MTDHAQDPRRAEFEALAVPHLDALYRFAARQLGAAHGAEAAVQDTCLKAYRAFDRFEQGTDFRAWLFRILVNTVTDRRRRAGRTARTVEGAHFSAVMSHPAQRMGGWATSWREGAAADVRRPRRGL